MVMSQGCQSYSVGALCYQVTHVTGVQLLPYEKMSIDEASPPLRIQPVFTL